LTIVKLYIRIQKLRYILNAINVTHCLINDHLRVKGCPNCRRNKEVRHFAADLKTVQRRDKIKNDYCKNNGFLMLRIVTSHIKM